MSWLLVFLGFCLLIMLHEAGHFVAAKATGMRVERFFLFFGPTIWSFKRGETEYGVKSIPLGGYVKINGMNPEEEMPPGEEHRAYYRQKVWKRIVVVAAGPAVNIVLAFAILFGVFKVGGLEDATTRVGAIKGGTPAEKVLKSGDEFVSVDGYTLSGLNPTERTNAFVGLIRSHGCAAGPVEGCRAATPVDLKVRRNGELRTITVRPEYDKASGHPVIGFSFIGEFVPISTSHAVDRSLEAIWDVTSRTATVLANILNAKERSEISGVVGNSDRGHQAVEEGWRQGLLLLALISLSLGLVNLLPILPLDGGHILWALLEKVRRGPVSVRAMERTTMVGIAFVIILFFIGLSNDIGRIVGGEALPPR